MKNFDAPQYLQLTQGGTSARMASLKSIAAKSPADQTWRKVRAYGFNTWAAAYGAMDQGFNGTDAHKVPVWYCCTGEQFRGENFADHIRETGNRGWYTNADGETWRDGSGLARGIVGRLTHSRFIAGYHWGDNDERVYFPEVFTDENDAARAADSHAESFAETCREDNAKFNAARDLETENENAFTRLRECITLRHSKCMAYVRDEIPDLIETIRANRETLKTEYAEFI